MAIPMHCNLNSYSWSWKDLALAVLPSSFRVGSANVCFFAWLVRLSFPSLRCVAQRTFHQDQTSVPFVFSYHHIIAGGIPGNERAIGRTSCCFKALADNFASLPPHVTPTTSLGARMNPEEKRSEVVKDLAFGVPQEKINSRRSAAGSARTKVTRCHKRKCRCRSRSNILRHNHPKTLYLAQCLCL